MKVRELINDLMTLPQDADVEICMREKPDYSADLEVTGAASVHGSEGTWVTILTGELVCDHA